LHYPVNKVNQSEAAAARLDDLKALLSDDLISPNVAIWKSQHSSAVTCALRLAGEDQFPAASSR
jgi:hypothetical protein